MLYKIAFDGKTIAETFFNLVLKVAVMQTAKQLVYAQFQQNWAEFIAASFEGVLKNQESVKVVNHCFCQLIVC